jgi:hypothetical protein
MAAAAKGAAAAATAVAAKGEAMAVTGAAVLAGEAASEGAASIEVLASAEDTSAAGAPALNGRSASTVVVRSSAVSMAIVDSGVSRAGSALIPAAFAVRDFLPALAPLAVCLALVPAFPVLMALVLVIPARAPRCFDGLSAALAVFLFEPPRPRAPGSVFGAPRTVMPDAVLLVFVAAAIRALALAGFAVLFRAGCGCAPAVPARFILAAVPAVLDPPALGTRPSVPALGALVFRTALLPVSVLARSRLVDTFFLV